MYDGTLCPGRDHRECVDLLISKGADVDEKNNRGETALMWASGKGHRECVDLLLSKGANVNEKDNDGTTALMVASVNGHRECVDLLLSKGANVNDGNVPKTGHSCDNVNGGCHYVHVRQRTISPINVQSYGTKRSLPKNNFSQCNQCAHTFFMYMNDRVFFFDSTSRRPCVLSVTSVSMPDMNV